MFVQRKRKALAFAGFDGRLLRSQRKIVAHAPGGDGERAGLDRAVPEQIHVKDWLQQRQVAVAAHAGIQHADAAAHGTARLTLLDRAEKLVGDQRVRRPFAGGFVELEALVAFKLHMYVEYGGQRQRLRAGKAAHGEEEEEDQEGFSHFRHFLSIQNAAQAMRHKIPARTRPLWSSRSRASGNRRSRARKLSSSSA